MSLHHPLTPSLCLSITLALLPLIYFFPVVMGQVALAPGDGWTQNIGVRVLAGRMIASGQLPLWNPYVYAGMPLLASVDPGALYPPNWLFALFPPAAAMNIVVISSYYLALVGMYLFARRIGRSRTGALVSGIIFAFGAFTIAHLAHTHRITALVWLPWVMLAIENLSRSESWQAAWRWVSLGAVSVALQLFAGDPQMTAYTIMLSAAYGLFLLARQESWAQRWRLIASALVMAVCGLLISAVQLLPERELLAQSERARLAYDYFSGYSLPPRGLLALIFPYFFGGADLPPFHVPYWGEWNAAVSAGYVGLLGLMLTLAALVLSSKSASTRFWLAIAVIAIILCFGGYLPFGLNRLLYHVPVYNLFRGSYRHFYEFTFAIAVLAGLGADLIAQSERAKVRRAVTLSVMALAVLVISTAILYRFLGSHLAGSVAYPATAGTFSNAEAWMPLIVFVISSASFWLYGMWNDELSGSTNSQSTFRIPHSAFRNGFLLAALLLDLASFGWFFQWRATPNNIAERLADPPTVRFIKAREADPVSFRVLSHFAFSYDQPVWDSGYDMLNWPDVSSARGLQCVNGADLFRLPRVAMVAGNMDAGGFVQDLTAIGGPHRGFDLLNTKYLLLARPILESSQAIVHDGINFSHTTFGLEFKPGVHLTTWPGGVAATELAVVSAMYGSTHLPDGAPVLRIKLHTRDGQVIERELQAGRDTSEWAYDHSDVRSNIRHARAHVVETEGAGNTQVYSYLAHLAFDQAMIDRIEWEYAREDAGLYLVRASLFDRASGAATPLNALSLPPERWRKLESFGQVDVYENLRLMPRAWFVRRVEAKPSAEVLRAIKEGSSSETAPFDPAKTALLDAEDFGANAITLPTVGDTTDAQVKVTRYEPQRIELETHNTQSGFLMLSEVYYRGWDAWVDGAKTPVYRADYALRGIAVPAGDHRVEFIFRAPTFRSGAIYAGLGVMVLLAGAIVIRVRSSRRNFL